MKKSIQEQLEDLRKNKTTIEEILRASAFDSENDINKHLTEDLFYRYLYVTSDALKELENKFENTINSVLTPNRVIFLSGYAGNGKTTFIKTFAKNKESYTHVYYDLQERRINRGQGAVGNEVELMIHRSIRQDDFNTIKTFNFLYTYRHEYIDNEFISKKVYDALCKIGHGKKITKEIIREWMSIFNFKDTFTCFFTHLFLHTNSEKKKIVYFDNLDIAAMEYISNIFLEYFEEALHNGNQLSRVIEPFQSRNIAFSNRYRFVFCLRDANDAIVNQHISSRISLHRVPFQLSFEPDYYKRIVEHRVDLIKLLFSDNDLAASKINLEDLTSAFNALIRDRYFNDVFVPLYNYDYRSAVSTLLNTIIQYDISGRVKKLNYGVRGFLLFGLINHLLQQDFLRDYLKLNADDEDGYCYVDRVLLTTIINSCDYLRDREKHDESNSYPLFMLIRDMTKLYKNINEVLESIARCFLYHKRDWVHLITIINKKVDDKEDFINNILEHIDSVNSAGKDTFEQVIFKNEINDIKIKVNPSGFTYVRYILPHFEFYSNIADNKSPLFIDELEVCNTEDCIYSFEVKMDKVLKVVENHLKSMRKFFDNYFLAIGVTPNVYYKSRYCFRHLGKSRKKLPSGYFHSSRIITSHIDYIDYFRIQVLNNYDLSDKTTSDINRRILKRIKRYVQLLENSLDEKAKKSFVSNFKIAIDKIKSSNYLDKETRFRIRGY